MNTTGKVIISYVILAIVIIGLLLFTSNIREKLKATEAREAQNLIALTDTISQYKNTNGELVSTKAVMQMTMKQLEIANDSLAQWVKDNPADVKVVTKVVTQLRYDTIISNESVIVNDSGRIGITFNYNQDQISFNSSTKFSVNRPVELSNTSLIVTNLAIDAGITTAIVEDSEGIKRIEVVSDNPHLAFTSIEGNIIPEDKIGFFDKFGLGIAIGPTANYDFIDKDFSIGIGITAGLVYKKIKRK